MLYKGVKIGLSRKGRDERVDDFLGKGVGDHKRVEMCIMWSLRTV